MENIIRWHISSIEAKYYPDILEAALNARLQTSKFSAAISSTTVENELWRLFEAQLSEAWASVVYTNAIQPRGGVSSETLSKIW